VFHTHFAKTSELVKDINAVSNSTGACQLIDLYFKQSEDIHGAEYWKTELTAAGTVLVKFIVSAGAGENNTFRAEIRGCN
jgi:ELWxxDGT repeat protein